MNRKAKVNISGEKRKVGRIAVIVGFIAVVSGVYGYYRNPDIKPDKGHNGNTHITGDNNTTGQKPYQVQGISQSEIGRAVKAFNLRNVPENSRICFNAGVSFLLGKPALEKQEKAELIKAIDKFKCSVKNYPAPENHYLLGKCYFILGEDDNAVNNLKESRELYKKDNDHKGEIAVLNNIWVIYNALENYNEAVKYLKEVFKIYTDIGDRSGEANTLNSIGMLYGISGNYNDAIKYHKVSLIILEETGAEAEAKKAKENIAYIESKLGQSTEQKPGHR